MKNVKGLPLKLHGMMSFEFWELHEACFILTEWPKNMVGIELLDSIREKFGRGVLYCPSQRFSHKESSKKCRKLIDQMEEAITRTELTGHPFLSGLGLENRYGKHSLCFIKVIDLIKWCVLHDVYLPEHIQDKYELYQQTDNRFLKTVQNKVKIKFLGQLIHYIYPKLSVGEIKNHSLMQKFGPSSLDENRRSIFRHLLDAFKIEYGKPGEETYVEKHLEPISEVVFREENGKARFSFASLRNILQVICNAKIEIIGLEKIARMCEFEFVEIILIDQFLHLYLRGASKTVISLCQMCCIEELSKRYSHPKMKLIPWSERKLMTIESLMKKNRMYCLEKFTPEERANFFGVE